MKKLLSTILLAFVSVSLSAQRVVTNECLYFRVGSRIKCLLSSDNKKCFIHMGLFTKKQPDTMLNDVFIIETKKGDIPLTISNSTSKSDISSGLYSIPIDIEDVKKIKKGVDCIKLKRNGEEKIYRCYSNYEKLEYEVKKVLNGQQRGEENNQNISFAQNQNGLFITSENDGHYGFPQNFREVVYLKNGSIIRGIIIEQVPNESMKIQTADGSLFVCKMEDVEKISKEISNVPIGKTNTGTPAPKTYRPVGYRGFLDVDGGFGVGDWGDGYIGFTTSHGGQTCPYFYIGVGFGALYHVFWETTFLPIFANMRFHFVDKRCSPFLDFKGGYSPLKGKKGKGAEGAYASVAFGVNYQFKPQLGINFSFGYTMQRSEFYIVNYYFNKFSKESMHHLGFKLGLEF